MTRQPNEPNRTPDRLEELVHAEIDGVLTKAETAELSALLAQDPAAERARAVMRELVDVLDRVEALEPPSALRRELLAALPTRRRVSAASSSGLLSRLRGTWTGRHALAYGYGLAAILVLAFVGREFISPVTTVGDGDGLTGTMAPKRSRPSSVEPSYPHEIQLEQPGLDGTIRLVRDTAGLIVQVDATSENPLVLVVSYPETRLGLTGIQRTDGLAASAETAPGQVSLGGAGPAGERRHAYQIRLSALTENVATPVHFTFLGSGEPVFEGTLALRAQGQDPAHEGRE